MAIFYPTKPAVATQKQVSPSIVCASGTTIARSWRHAAPSHLSQETAFALVE